MSYNAYDSGMASNNHIFDNLTSEILFWSYNYKGVWNNVL